jgi:hypothetical protein
MGADAIHVVALGLALLPIYVAVVATVFCQRALRGGGEFEAEIKAPALSLRLRAKGSEPSRNPDCIDAPIDASSVPVKARNTARRAA